MLYSSSLATDTNRGGCSGSCCVCSPNSKDTTSIIAASQTSKTYNNHNIPMHAKKEKLSTVPTTPPSTATTTTATIATKHIRQGESKSTPTRRRPTMQKNNILVLTIHIENLHSIRERETVLVDHTSPPLKGHKHTHANHSRKHSNALQINLFYHPSRSRLTL